MKERNVHAIYLIIRMKIKLKCIVMQKTLSLVTLQAKFACHQNITIVSCFTSRSHFCNELWDMLVVKKQMAKGDNPFEKVGGGGRETRK